MIDGARIVLAIQNVTVCEHGGDDNDAARNMSIISCSSLLVDEFMFEI